MATSHWLRQTIPRLVRVALVLIVAVVPLRLAAQQRSGREITDTAAAVEMARATFREAESARVQGDWSRTENTVHCDEDDLGREVSIDRDTTGLIRRLEWSGGTEDHAEKHRYFYDASGKLRFAFFTLGAVNGTQQEERVYYGSHGEVVRRLKRVVSGPGYPSTGEEGVPDALKWLGEICP